MNDELEIRDRILQKAEEMFINFGISRVTMDELAQELGMSKKTVYKYFENKEHLIKEIIKAKKCENGDVIEKIISDDSLDFIDKLKRLMTHLSEMSKQLRKPLIDDLTRSYPNIFKNISDFRKNYALAEFEKLIAQGIDEGFFRPDISKEIVVLVYISAIHAIIVPEVLVTLPLSADQVFKSIIAIIFKGVLSDKGRECLTKKTPQTATEP